MDKEQLNQLINQLRDGDESGFTLLYEKRPHNIIPKLQGQYYTNFGEETLNIIEDAFQEAAIKLYQKLMSGEINSGNLRGWLYTTTNRRILDYIKKTLIVPPMPPEINSEDMEEQEKDYQLYDKAFEQLDPICQKLLKLRYFSGMSAKKIAKEMGYKNEKVVNTTAYQCKEKLKILVTKIQHQP